MKFSVTSVAIPDLDVPETCRLLAKLGFDGVEWRVRHTPPGAVGKGYSPWGEHKTDLSPANILERADEVRKVTSDHGLEIAAIASSLPATDIEGLKRLAEGAERLGRVPVRLGAPRGYDRTAGYHELFQETVDAFGRALDLLEPHGVRALAEIHCGTIFVSASLAHRVLSRFSPDRVGAIYDINNMCMDGFETFRIGMELLGPYLQHVHAGGHIPARKGLRADGSAEWVWEKCNLQDGLMNLGQFMADLKSVRYCGYISIEDFRAMDHEAKLRPQIEFLRRLDAGV